MGAAVFAPRCSEKADERLSLHELEVLAQRIEKEIEVLRGAKFIHPVELRIATRADLQSLVKRFWDRCSSPERDAADETIAKLLGLIPPDMALVATTFRMFEEQVSGYYDPFEDSLSVMETVPKSAAATCLAHELVHALDDQLFGLDEPLFSRASSTDAGLAALAVVEGSATSLMNQWTMQYESDTRQGQDLGGAPLDSLPMRVWKPFIAPYLIGTAFLARTDSTLLGQTRAVSAADVEQAFRALPRSTEQVLHPEKYWSSTESDEPREVTLQFDDLPTGWSVAREDTLGELGLAMLCTPPEERGCFDESNPMAVYDVRFTNQLAAGWGGDRVVLLTNGASRYLVLATRWDTERDAAEFHDALLLLRPSLDVAARALAGSSEGESGVEIDYRTAADEVVLTIHSAVERRDLSRLEKRKVR